MKKTLMALLVAATFSQASAQSVQIRDAFREMPDSLMPYLSKNNRLDFIDFLDSGMKAEVRNQLGGTSQMLSIADDSLSIQMNPLLFCHMATRCSARTHRGSAAAHQAIGNAKYPEARRRFIEQTLKSYDFLLLVYRFTKKKPTFAKCFSWY